MAINKPHDICEQGALPWPYPVRYREQTKLSCDVLVLGGGVGGSRAAIAAAKEGVSVIIVDKAPISRSGGCGTGQDHWTSACTNPASKIDSETFVKQKVNNWLLGPMKYIMPETSYDAFSELEQMGCVLRDYQDEFKGSAFRDEESKLLYAYDYENKWFLRMPGGNYQKPILAKEMDRLGITRVERVMGTKLLYNDIDGKRRVNGAIGIHTQTGEMYIFEAKTVIIATGSVYGMWNYRNDVIGAPSDFSDPNGSGDGYSMAWNIGAEFVMMERAGTPGFGGFVNGQPAGGGAGYMASGYPCSIVDADGKEIPWVNCKGEVLKTFEERTKPAFEGFAMGDGAVDPRGGICMLIPDLGERIKKGEYKLPLYMDLPGMPADERRVIWGVMIGNEGKTLYPSYNKLDAAGFDPDKDMLQANMASPDIYNIPGAGFWEGEGDIKNRDSGNFNGAGGFLINWNLESTNIECLFGAGHPIMASAGAPASVSGRYSGRHAAKKAQLLEQIPLDQKQIDEETERLYAVLDRTDTCVGWRELQNGLNRIMRDYLTDYKQEHTIKIGEAWLKSLKETEAQQVYVRNPHELFRYLEVESRMIVAEMFMEACLKRVQHDGPEFFQHMRLPWEAIEDWGPIQVLSKSDNGFINVKYIDPDYELKAPYASTHKENFKKFNPDYEEKYRMKEDGSWKNLRQY